MRRKSFNNAHSYGYDIDKVIDMLDKGLPLLIYSIPGIDITNSHCWNIDGYKTKERDVITETYKGATLIKTTSTKETQTMVHCDFGWGGICNGFYVSGVFKLNDPNAELDGPRDDKKRHYNHFVKIITYNL